MSVARPVAPALFGTPAIGFSAVKLSLIRNRTGRAQKLAKALKACGNRFRTRRAACERQARKKFGSAKRKRGG
jgi:thermostable 8-oxoguanine DNA glycosylase